TSSAHSSRRRTKKNSAGKKKRSAERDTSEHRRSQHSSHVVPLRGRNDVVCDRRVGLPSPRNRGAPLPRIAHGRRHRRREKTMTVASISLSEAVETVASLLLQDADHSNTRHAILTRREVAALQRLMADATITINQLSA